MNRISFTLFIIILSTSTYGYYPPVNNYSKIAYRAGAQNWSITQNDLDLMYFANNQGLLEFDSEKWKIYPISNGTNIRSVLYASGKIYAGAFNEFGYYEKNISGILEYHSLMKNINQKITNINEVWQIHQNDNSVFFRADQYIFEYKNDKIRTIPIKDKVDISALINNVLFISTLDKGPCILNENTFIPILGAEVLIGKKVCAILPYSNNLILFVTSLHGIYYFDGQSIKPFHTDFDNFLQKNQVFCAATNGQQIVYGTVQKGIVIQNLNGDDELYINSFSGLQNNTVLSILFDNQNNLWLGLDKGIDYIRLNSNIYNMFASNNLFGAGYASLLNKNTLYLGTNQGLYYTRYPQKSNPHGFDAKLLKDMKGQVWFLEELDGTIFCGNDEGLYTINGENKERIVGLPGTWAVKKMTTQPDCILGCSYKGLFILKKKDNKWIFSHYIKGKFNEVSAMFEEDNLGQIWFSHWQKGVYRLTLNSAADSIINISLYDKNKGFPTNRNNTFYKINNELIFSSEYGFFTYNSSTDRMEVNNKWNNHFNHPPNSIRLKESKTGDVWCISSIFCGVLQKQESGPYKIDSLSYKPLQSSIIIGFEDFNFIGDSSLIVSTENGFSWVNLRRDIRKKATLKLLIRSVVISQKDESKVSSIVFNNVNRKKHILKKSQNSIRIEFIAPFYQQEEDIQYSYILENFDKAWSEYNIKNIKEYTALPQGEYIFKVRAINTLTSETAETYYTFSILPAWYETKFAYLIYTIITISLIAISLLLVKRKIKRNAAKIKKQKDIELLEEKLKFDIMQKEKKQEIVHLKNQKLESELKHKSQELANSTMNLMRKNEMLLNLNENLSKIIDKVQGKPESKDICNHIKSIELDIKQNVESDDYWNRFEDNFDLVYGNYLKRLEQLYPSINLVEKKICAYLRMGLSSKEISALLGLSVRSIETTRYRLRKKFGLSREISLTEFLQKF